MAVGTYMLGRDARVSVAPNTGTALAPVAGTYVQLSGMNTLSHATSANDSTEAVFESDLDINIPGSRSQSLTLSGLLYTGDAGQTLVIAADGTTDILFIKVLWDGTNGFSQPVKVSGKTGGTTKRGAATVSFTLPVQAAGTAIAAGPAL